MTRSDEGFLIQSFAARTSESIERNSDTVIINYYVLSQLETVICGAEVKRVGKTVKLLL